MRLVTRSSRDCALRACPPGLALALNPEDDRPAAEHTRSREINMSGQLHVPGPPGSASRRKSSRWPAAGTCGFGLSYRDVEELLARTRHRGEPRDRTPVGWAVHPVVRRGRPGPAGAPRGPLVRRRDVCEAQRPVALPVGTVSTARQGVRLPPSCEKRNDAKRTESRYETATAPSLHS